MSTFGKIARRTFLIGGAAIAGGVAFGVWTVRRPHANPLKEGLRAGEAALTPFIKITAEGVTLITPRADLGQGAYHLQAALIAEELDIGLDAVTVDPGEPAPVYYNRALAAEAVPFPSTDRSAVAEAARASFGHVVKTMGLQLTGGSTTAADMYERLREAGAVARETLKEAAAIEAGMPEGSGVTLATQNGAVILPDGTARPYTALADAAAAIPVARNVALRPPSEWRLIGQEMRRLDMVAKSTGTLPFGIDRQPEDPGEVMLHAALRLSPRFGAGIASFDDSAARGMRGVLAVLRLPDGVAVVADNTWRAMRAVDAVEIAWEDAPYPPEMDAHWRVLGQTLATGEPESTQKDRGAVDTAIAEADATIELEFRAPYLAHAPLEPVSATVRVTDNRADLWTGTQIPRFVQRDAAEAAGLHEGDVHVHAEYVGGSFGHRLESDIVRPAIAVGRRFEGRTVKVTMAREHDMARDYPRQIALARARGAARSGRVEGLDLAIAMPSVMASQLGRQGQPAAGPDTQIVTGAWDQPWNVPHYRVRGYRAEGLAPVSSWRAVGASTNGFFHEVALDATIHAAGADPLEERLRLIDDAASRRVLEAVAEMCGWSGPRPAEGRGRGLAFVHSFGVPTAEVVEVSTSEAGIRIETVWVAAEVGRVLDPVNFENQVQGGVIWGLDHAMFAETTFADGMVEQVNYDWHEHLRIDRCPEILVRGLETTGEVRGIGEPPVPPAAPALANAIFAATGTRLTSMPFSTEIRFA
jgi:isoquinoline 1-oxidoreductase beta subunit